VPLTLDGAGFLKSSMLAAVVAGARGEWSMQTSSTAWAGGSDRPELQDVNVGFIPLTDCASVVVASALGFDRKYGIRIRLSREASWAAVRDKLINGELDAAQVLYGLVYGAHLGIGGPRQDMAVLMGINQNGQSISLSNHFRERGITTGVALKKDIAASGREYTFAQTFPTGTHAMWLHYWLAAHGIDPLRDVRTIVVPPPQMVANVRVGNMDGFCAGEPWGARAIYDNAAFTVATSQDIWPDHPEKVLGCTAEFVRRQPNTARALIMAVLDAARFVDDVRNRPEVARLISGKAYVDAPEDVIVGRFLGHYENGLGRKWEDAHHMQFFDDGRISFPYYSDGMWFLTQHRRWGLLRSEPDYLAVAKAVNQVELYTQAATQLKVALPSSPLRSSRLIDGRVWDGRDPAAYVAGFDIGGRPAVPATA
jgi:nitrate/nitrite transport system substrate-binding protein